MVYFDSLLKDVLQENLLKAIQSFNEYVFKNSIETVNGDSLYEEWIKKQPEILCTHVGMFIKVRLNKGI